VIREEVKMAKRKRKRQTGLGHVTDPMIVKIEKIMGYAAQASESAAIGGRTTTAKMYKTRLKGMEVLASHIGVECLCAPLYEKRPKKGDPFLGLKKCFCARTMAEAGDKIKKYQKVWRED